MKGWNELGSGGKFAAVGAVVVAVAAGALLWLRATPPVVPPKPPAVAGAPAVGLPAPSTPAPTSQAPTSQTTSQPAAQAPAPAAVPAPVVPSFDIVRVTPEGSATVAGQGAAGAVVDVRVEDASAATAPVDGSGHFAALFSLAPSDQPRVLTLVETLADGTRVASTQSVIIAPTPKPAEVASAAPAAGQGAAADATATASATVPAPVTADATQPATVAPATSATVPAAETGTAPAPAAEAGTAGAGPTVAGAPGAGTAPATGAETAALPGAIAPATETQPGTAPATPTADGTVPTGAQAPAVLLADKGSVTVLQPAVSSAESLHNIGIDAIAYSETGAVELSGHGAAGANVRIYIDNAPVIAGKIGADGKWKLTLPELHEGVYTLRADQIDDTGKVTSRFETPFKRESATALTSAGVIGGPSVGVRAAIITVQPGYTLWGIARANLGSGILYVKVFAANRDQIRNPDLIYPGQVFAVPGSN